MKLYLHIGIEKTGTSSIQSFLYENRNQILKNYKIFYPEIGLWHDKSHHKIAFSLIKQDLYHNDLVDFDKILESIVIEAKNKKAKSVFISTEIFRSLVNRVEYGLFIERIKKYFDYIEIIIFLRDQPYWIISMYNQFVKDVAIKYIDDFNSFYKMLYNSMDYHEIITKWEKDVNKVTVFRYLEKNNPNRRSSIDIILEYLNIDKNILDFKGNLYNNMSLNRIQFELYKYFNSLKLNDDVRRKINRIILDNFAEKEYDMLLGEYSILSKEEKQNIHNHFKPSNDKISSKYFKQDLELFPDITESYKYKDIDIFHDNYLDIVFTEFAKKNIKNCFYYEKREKVNNILNNRPHPFHYTLNNKKIKIYNVTYKEYKNVYILPAKTNFYPQNKAEYPLYDNKLNPIYSSTLQRSKEGGKISFYKKDINSLRFDSLKGKKNLYGGYILNSYGHFITETLSRLWYFIEFNEEYCDTNIIFNTQFNNINVNDLFDWQKDIFKLLNIPLENIILINKNVKVDNIIIPEQAIEYRDNISFVMNKIWDTISQNARNITGKYINSCYKNIYLSRKKVKNPVANRYIANEDEIEKLFASKGFKIIYPEEYLPSELITILTDTDIIASLSGSGLHNSIFMNKSSKVIQIASVFSAQGTYYQSILDYIRNNSLYNFFSNERNHKNENIINIDELDYAIDKIL